MYGHMNVNRTNVRNSILTMIALSYIYKDEYLFVPWTNPHFWTDRNQTLHTSPQWSGRDHRVCMGPQYFTFPTFSTYFVGSECRFMRNSWLPAPHYPTTRYCVISVMRHVLVWHHTRCVVQWKCGEVNRMRVCENGNLMRREGSDLELHLQLHCIYTNDNVKPILPFARLSVPCLRTTHAFTFSTFPVVPARCFANGMTRQCCQPWESRVCLCRQPLCLYTFFDLVNLFCPFWEMFCERHDNTVIHASRMGKYILHVQ